MSSRGYPFEQELTARQTSTARARHTGRTARFRRRHAEVRGDTPNDRHDGYDIARSRHLTVRLFSCEERYAATWRHGPRRGQMHGRIEK